MHIIDESSKCLMCKQAPCTAACPKGQNPSRGIRALRFDNKNNAGIYFGEACADCPAPCESVCIHYDQPIRIKQLAAMVTPRKGTAEADLSIDFCGVHCENPFFLGSSVIASNYEMISHAFDMGWGGAVYKTISKINIQEVSPRFDIVNKEGTPFIGFRNMEQLSEHSYQHDLEVMSRLKQDYPTKVIVASIMGRDDAEWAELAAACEKAGVDIIECNFSCPQMATKGTGSDVGQIPELVARYTRVVKAATSLPVLAKMTPNITHICDPASAAIEAGADGIAAINTIKCVTINYTSEVTNHKTVSGYSGKAVKPIAQRMILEMAKDERIAGHPLSGIGGIETWRDAMEYILVGCTNVQVVTAVMEYGYRIIEDLKSGMADCILRHGKTGIMDFVGDALDRFVPAEELDRNTYIMPHFNHDVCIGCGRCYISCADGGHQAITFGEDRRPHIIGRKCVGCHLCKLVCPTGAIVEGRRIPKLTVGTDD